MELLSAFILKALAFNVSVNLEFRFMQPSSNSSSTDFGPDLDRMAGQSGLSPHVILQYIAMVQCNEVYVSYIPINKSWNEYMH